jgi:hypothetical protein
MFDKSSHERNATMSIAAPSHSQDSGIEAILKNGDRTMSPCHCGPQQRIVLREEQSKVRPLGPEQPAPDDQTGRFPCISRELRLPTVYTVRRFSLPPQGFWCNSWCNWGSAWCRHFLPHSRQSVLFMTSYPSGGQIEESFGRSRISSRLSAWSILPFPKKRQSSAMRFPELLKLYPRKAARAKFSKIDAESNATRARRGQLRLSRDPFWVAIFKRSFHVAIGILRFLLICPGFRPAKTIGRNFWWCPAMTYSAQNPCSWCRILWDSILKTSNLGPFQRLQVMAGHHRIFALDGISVFVLDKYI